MGDIVKFRKMTTAGYNSLADKRSNTLYFVNDTGDFSPQSMDETEGDIYLGDKLLTGKGSSRVYHPGANVGIGKLDPFGEYTPLESAYNGNQSTKIDTGVNTYNDDVEFRITFKQTQTGLYMRLFGADTGGSLRYRIGFVAFNTTDITLCSRSETGALTSSITRTKDHVYTLVGKLKNGNIALYVRDETTGETDLQTGTYDVDMSYNPRIQLFYLSQQNAYQASGTHVYQATLIVRGGYRAELRTSEAQGQQRGRFHQHRHRHIRWSYQWIMASRQQCRLRYLCHRSRCARNTRFHLRQRRNASCPRN